MCVYCECVFVDECVFIWKKKQKIVKKVFDKKLSKKQRSENCKIEWKDIWNAENGK